MEVKAKGIEHPITVSEVLGIGRPHRLFLPEAAEELVQLAQEIPLTYSIIEANQPGGDICKGTLTRLSRKGAEVRLENSVETFSNLEMHLMGKEGQKLPGALYGKVVGTVPGTEADFSVCFTSIPPEIELFFSGLLAQPAGLNPNRRERKSRSAVALHYPRMVGPYRLVQRSRKTTAEYSGFPSVLSVNGTKRTVAPAKLMSASGTKRTSMLTLSMSAFRGKADMPSSLANVR
jgi:hypothetical protein